MGHTIQSPQCRFLKDFFLAVRQTVGVEINMSTEKHTIAVAQLRMVLAWTRGNKWIDSKDIKETKSRGLGHGCHGETSSTSPTLACQAMLGILHPGELGSTPSTTDHLGLFEEQLGKWDRPE